MKNRLLLVTLLGLLPCASTSAQDPVSNSVVKIHVTNREPDFSRPWAKGSPKQVSGSGVIIDGKWILTK